MPERLAYDEAMLFASARLRIADAELKNGKVEIVSTQTALGPIERPWGIEGGFAVVYKFRTASGKLRALRCFRVAMNHDMQFRYERMGPFFQHYVRDIMADFHYYAAALVVKEQEQGTLAVRTYPVIDMEWIDGHTLLETVALLCQRGDVNALHYLAQQWLHLLSRLRQCGMAHGDLAAVNVMVRPDGQLVLVDYDGVFIPEFAPEFANLSRVLLGQLDYQHPNMVERNFDAYMDDFSALVIYTALLALADQPERWGRYAKLDAHGRLLDSNLLFTQRDFQTPQHSQLFRELESAMAATGADAERLLEAARLLHQSCLLPVNEVRFPAQWLATHAGSLATPADSSLLSLTGTASGQPEKGLSVADDVQLAAPDQSEAELLRPFLRACAENDDIAIAAAYEEIANFNHYGAVVFSAAQLQRALLAQQRRSALARFRVALANRRPLQIATAYNDRLLQAMHGITAHERALLALARQFQCAYVENDGAALLHTYAEMQRTPYLTAFVFSAQECQRIEQAQAHADISM
jgi:Serine/threonine protein kinase